MKPHSRLSGKLALLAILPFLFGFFQREENQPLEPLNLAKAAILAQQSNLTAFTYYTCRFRFTKAQAANSEAAFLGKYGNVRDCEFLLVRDGEKEKYVSFAPAPPRDVPKNAARGKEGTRSMPLDFVPFAELRLGDEALSYFSPFEQAEVQEKEDLRENPIPKPFSFGGAFGPKAQFSPVSLLARDGNGRITMQSQGRILLDQKPVIHVGFTSTEFGKIDYYLDPQQGFLPSEIVENLISPEGRKYPEYRTRVLEVRKTSNNRWFPWHVVRTFALELKGQAVFVHDFQVMELDVDKKPTAEDLSIELPPNTRIQTSPLSKRDLHFRLRKAEKVSPVDIPKLAKMLEQDRESKLEDTAVNKTEFNFVAWILTGMGAAVLGVSIFLFWQFRTRQVS